PPALDQRGDAEQQRNAQHDEPQGALERVQAGDAGERVREARAQHGGGRPRRVSAGAGSALSCGRGARMMVSSTVTLTVGPRPSTWAFSAVVRLPASVTATDARWARSACSRAGNVDCAQ